MVVGRNGDAIVDALRMLAGSLGQIPQGKFQRNNPPIFEGEHEPNKAQAWLKAIEKIFRIMNCIDLLRVQFGTDMLIRKLRISGVTLLRGLEKRNYFPEDFHGKKEVEFHELKQGNGIVAEYAEKFQELIKYCPHYNTMNAKMSKCLKFVNGLRHDIKKAIRYQQITRFEELVNKRRIYAEDSRESASHYKVLNDGKGKGQYRGKPYDDKKKKYGYDRKPNEGGTSAPVKGFKCGVEGHRANECNKNSGKCFECDKPGHKAVDCRSDSGVTCYNCGEQGHISIRFDKPNKEQAKGKVFSLSDVDTTVDDRLI
ncbi:uncharacterized protein LOC131662423 [Vicia villosa]|uniref:uncharacterized protein LOC131662423 n=1 Tax=Vicia villosa TaxID=3911 RepID=UPI00273C27EA|nr:uncharacterized protein LOC131662423 [Vicia villosa]